METALHQTACAVHDGLPCRHMFHAHRRRQSRARACSVAPTPHGRTRRAHQLATNRCDVLTTARLGSPVTCRSECHGPFPCCKALIALLRQFIFASTCKNGHFSACECGVSWCRGGNSGVEYCVQDDRAGSIERKNSRGIHGSGVGVWFAGRRSDWCQVQVRRSSTFFTVVCRKKNIALTQLMGQGAPSTLAHFRAVRTEVLVAMTKNWSESNRNARGAAIDRSLLL